jgi:deoxyhypusine synthase
MGAALSGTPDATLALLLSRAAYGAGLRPADLIPALSAHAADLVVSSTRLLEVELGLDQPPGPKEDRKGLVRLQDVTVERRHLRDPVAFTVALITSTPFQRILASSVLCGLLGRYLGERERLLGEPASLLSTAAGLGVPVFVPYLMASTFGMLLAAQTLDGNRLTHDASLDLNELAAILLAALGDGGSLHVVALGGQGPLWFLLRALRHLREGLGLDVPTGGLHLFLCEPRQPPSDRAESLRLLREEGASGLGSVNLVDGPPAKVLEHLAALQRPGPRRLADEREDLVERLRKVHVEATALKMLPRFRLRLPGLGSQGD